MSSRRGSWVRWSIALFLAASATVWAQAAQNGAGAKRELEAPYRIGPGDVLQIDVWKEPDASIASITVRPDGRISMPMIGEIRVVDFTPAELEKALAEKFGTLIRDPRVIVTVRDATSHKVYVIGEVRREGAVRMSGPMTVLQALAEAGGVTDYAKRRQIYVLRVADGRQVRLPFDYEAVLKGRNVQQNLKLLPGDTVVVPR